MNHAITIGGLLLSLGIVAGLGFTAFGALMVFAGGMSDAPSAGDNTSGIGCGVLVVGILLLTGGIIGLVL